MAYLQTLGGVAASTYVVQSIQSSNDISSVNSVTSTSFATASMPYVNITPKLANSKYLMTAKAYGSWNNSIPVIGFSVSTDAGSTYTDNVAVPTMGYASWFTWGDMPEFTMHCQGIYISTFAAAATNIRFTICHKNIYHPVLQNSYNISGNEDGYAFVNIQEIAT